MAANIEREIKLQFDSPEAAQIAINKLGASHLRGRRLQDDRLFDWPDGRLRKSHSSIRLRREGKISTLTFKGPPQSTTMKVREEIETTVQDESSLVTILERLGLRLCFHYQKYRQEFQHLGVVLAIDETPIGTFVELEGNKSGITTIATAM